MRAGTDSREVVMEHARRLLPPSVLELVDAALQEAVPQSRLVGVLHKLQEELGWLPPRHLDAVAQLLRVPTARVTGVATFYHFFRTTPRGRHVIRVCTGTACYVKGADRVAARLQDELGVRLGETSTDQLFTVEAARCLGTCGLAPILMVDEQAYPQVDPDDVPGILRQYQAESPRLPPVRVEAGRGR